MRYRLKMRDRLDTDMWQALDLPEGSTREQAMAKARYALMNTAARQVRVQEISDVMFRWSTIVTLTSRLTIEEAWS